MWRYDAFGAQSAVEYLRKRLLGLWEVLLGSGGRLGRKIPAPAVLAGVAFLNTEGTAMTW
jgi:hypothetical protein